MKFSTFESACERSRVFGVNGENWRKQRTACLRCRRAPPRLGFVPECGSRGIRRKRIPCRKWKTGDGLRAPSDDGDGLKWTMGRCGRSRHESKACYWTEGVPSVKKRTGFGRTRTAAESATESESVVAS